MKRFRLFLFPFDYAEKDVERRGDKIYTACRLFSFQTGVVLVVLVVLLVVHDQLFLLRDRVRRLIRY